MEYVEVAFDQLKIDPTNYRHHYEGIDTLAESIAEHGLLQNLVVVPQPDGSYLVKAGNRRLLAIHKLVEQERWPPAEPIMCLVVDDDPWIDITENLIRDDVPPWRTGLRYLELIDAGHTMVVLAGKLKVSLGTISNYCAIGRGLHPKIMDKLERLGHKTLTRAQHLALARAVNEWYEPCLKDQERLLERFLATRLPKVQKDVVRRRLPPKTHQDNVYARFKRLAEGAIALPTHVHGFVIPILQYLNGDVKHPRFPPRPKNPKLIE